MQAFNRCYINFMRKPPFLGLRPCSQATIYVTYSHQKSENFGLRSQTGVYKYTPQRLLTKYFSNWHTGFEKKVRSRRNFNKKKGIS